MADVHRCPAAAEPLARGDARRTRGAQLLALRRPPLRARPFQSDLAPRVALKCT